MFLLEDAIVIWLVNYPTRTMLSVTFTLMVSFSIEFLEEFSILRMSLHPLGDLTAPAVALSIKNI